ncbi:hypothetical protein GCM10018781_71600 [Kitasatospora indigofera]|uniref:Uncharacterized protein n=1 Tax=Kitasatospora indigofera TaxID=67307 RepID=A0A919GG73_9ACTN|nr:hypothetical protein GCM10018781_71600 [Kitasatospora indigofera]
MRVPGVERVRVMMRLPGFPHPTLGCSSGLLPRFPTLWRAGLWPGTAWEGPPGRQVQGGTDCHGRSQASAQYAAGALGRQAQSRMLHERAAPGFNGCRQGVVCGCAGLR